MNDNRVWSLLIYMIVDAKTDGDNWIHQIYQIYSNEQHWKKIIRANVYLYMT